MQDIKLLSNKEIQGKENDGKDNISSKNESDKKQSFKNLKKIRKDLMSFAKNEILDIKKSKKEISVANFDKKEYLAPSSISLTTKKLDINSSKKYSSHFEIVEEKLSNKKSKEIKDDNNKEDKNQISSSDISDEDDDEDN